MLSPFFECVYSSIYINLFCFLVSRPRTVPSPKKGHTKVVIRESTVCLSGLALSLKQGVYPYESASPKCVIYSATY